MSFSFLRFWEKKEPEKVLPIPVKNKPRSFLAEKPEFEVADCLHAVYVYKRINPPKKQHEDNSDNPVWMYYFYKDYRLQSNENSAMIPLEAVCGAYYKFLVPGKVSTTRAHYDEKDRINRPLIGVSSKAIKGFKSIAKNPLVEADLNDEEIVKGLALGLTASYIFEEDDLHPGNMDKYGNRIDFDMSLWPVFYNEYKNEWYFRDPSGRFLVRADDILHFPILQPIVGKWGVINNHFYWPPNNPSIIKPLFKAIEKVSRYNPDKNTYPDQVIEVFKKLETNKTFRYYKYRTLLKFILSDEQMYRNIADLHIKPSINNIKSKETDIQNKLEMHLQARIHSFRETLILMSDFQNFLMEDGEKALREIRNELTERNQKLKSKLAKMELELANLEAQEIYDKPSRYMRTQEDQERKENRADKIKQLKEAIPKYQTLIIPLKEDATDQDWYKQEDIITLRYRSIYADSMAHRKRDIHHTCIKTMEEEKMKSADSDEYAQAQRNADLANIALADAIKERAAIRSELIKATDKLHNKIIRPIDEDDLDFGEPKPVLRG